jgi:chromosome segregation ATPase
MMKKPTTTTSKGNDPPVKDTKTAKTATTKEMPKTTTTTTKPNTTSTTQKVKETVKDPKKKEDYLTNPVNKLHNRVISNATQELIKGTVRKESFNDKDSISPGKGYQTSTKDGPSTVSLNLSNYDSNISNNKEEVEGASVDLNYVSNTQQDELKNQLLQKESELAQFKKVLQEKKELQDQLGLIRKDRDDWHKKYEERDAMINSCLKELDDSSKTMDQIVKEKEDCLAQIQDHKIELEVKANEIEELKNKITDMELDLELKNEEYEALKIDLEAANSKINELDELNRQNVTKDNAINELSNLDSKAASLKIIDLETQIKKLTNTLIKVSEDRTRESIYYKKEIDTLDEKLKLTLKSLEEIPK